MLDARRRQFITLLGGAAAWPLAARAQQPLGDSTVKRFAFDQVFASLVQQRADALFVSADPLFASKREHLVALAAQHAMSATYEFREFVEAGGLMSYGTVLSDGYYKGGNYVGKVLKGTKPADLPVEQVN